MSISEKIRYKGFLDALLEANAYGAYALVNNCLGGINEVIEEGLNGSVVNFSNSELVAKKNRRINRYEIR